MSAKEQRAASGDAHREGGTQFPGSEAAALPPNDRAARFEALLRHGGIWPDVARLTAKAWEARHGQIMRGGGR